VTRFTGRVRDWDDVRVTADEQLFRMTVREIVTLTRRPGVHLGGKIESGVVRVGDQLDLLDGDTVVRALTC
jgi:translation elongation factor EF-Tu-like GTPase